MPARRVVTKRPYRASSRGRSHQPLWGRLRGTPSPCRTQIIVLVRPRFKRIEASEKIAELLRFAAPQLWAKAKPAKVRLLSHPGHSVGCELLRERQALPSTCCLATAEKP